MAAQRRRPRQDWFPNGATSVARAARLRQHVTKVGSTTASAMAAHNNVFREKIVNV